MANGSSFFTTNKGFGSTPTTYSLGGTTLTPSKSMAGFNPSSLVADIAGVGAAGQAALSASQSAITNVGEVKAQSLLANVSLLRGDAARLRETGGQVFESESRKALQRTDTAAGSFIASGVTIEGSAAAVVQDIQREGAKEALARRSEYEFQARRTQMQADIAERQATLEREAARIEATSFVTNARAESKKSLAQYLVSNAASMQQVSRLKESDSILFGPKTEVVSAPDPISESIYNAALNLYKTL